MKIRILSLILILTILLFSIFSCKNDNQEDESNSSSQGSSNISDNNSDSGSVKDYSESSNSSTNSGNSDAPVLIPGTSEPISSPNNWTVKSSLSINELDALPNKKYGWGPGIGKNSSRPDGCDAYQSLYKKYEAYFIAPDTKKVYITFDEGYENGYTPKILDTLKEKNVSAVFFVTYDFASHNQDLVERMINEGHIVGNHSHKHPSFPTVSSQRMVDEVAFLHDYIKQTFNYEMKYFRFPMGEFSERTLAAVQSLGYKSVFWSFAYRDWEVNNQMGEEAAFKKISDNSHNGAIYLLHAVSKDNAAILGRVIDDIRSKGYEITKFDL